MRLSNLWLFFLNGEGVATPPHPKPRVVLDDESGRLFRRAATVRADALQRLLPVVGRPRVVATARATPHGVSVRLQLGRVRATSVAYSAPPSTRATTRLSAVTVRASAQLTVRVTPLLRATTGDVTSSSGSASIGVGSALQMHLGRVRVEIGPDLVQREDEELLFVLLDF